MVVGCTRAECTVRVAYSSDWHLGAFPEFPAADFDVLVCAGDICEVGEPQRAIRSVVEYACGKSVVAVAGNHDLYTSNPEDKRTNNDFIRLMRAEAQRQDDAADDDIVHVFSPLTNPSVGSATVLFRRAHALDRLDAGRPLDFEPGTGCLRKCGRRTRVRWRDIGIADPRSIARFRTERGICIPDDCADLLNTRTRERS